MLVSNATDQKVAGLFATPQSWALASAGASRKPHRERVRVRPPRRIERTGAPAWPQAATAVSARARSAVTLASPDARFGLGLGERKDRLEKRPASPEE